MNVPSVFVVEERFVTDNQTPVRTAWFRRLLQVAPPVGARSVAVPSAFGREAALAKLSELTALDVGIPEATRTRLYEPDEGADTTIIIWHGFTNAPSQFGEAAESLRTLGYRVLVPRMPHHGQSDLLNHDLKTLTVADLVGQVDACVDIASGLGPRSGRWGCRRAARWRHGRQLPVGGEPAGAAGPWWHRRDSRCRWCARW